MTDSIDPRDEVTGRDVRPIVPLPRARLTGFGIAVACAALGVGLFSVLEAKRSGPPAATPDQIRQPPMSSPPPLAVPQPPPLAPAITQTAASAEPVAPPVAPTRPVPRSQSREQPLPLILPSPPEPRSSAMANLAGPVPPPYEGSRNPMPAMLQRVGTSGNDDAILLMDKGPGEARTPDGAGGNGSDSSSGNAGNQASSGDDQAVRATLIRNRSSLVSQGTIIAAVLETPINSDRPGMARAVVTADVRGFDGTRVLIPRGSRLIGETQGDAKAGQKRVLVNWTRLIRPDGVAIRIGSPAGDALGGTGISGSVNNHVMARFTNAVLQTALSVGVARASRSGSDSIYVGVPGQIGSAITQVPIFNAPSGPTIKVREGAKISIFVARDLDFGTAGAHP